MSQTKEVTVTYAFGSEEDMVVLKREPWCSTFKSSRRNNNFFFVNSKENEKTLFWGAK